MHCPVSGGFPGAPARRTAHPITVRRAHEPPAHPARSALTSKGPAGQPTRAHIVIVMTDTRPTSAFHAANADPAVTERLAAALDMQAANAGVRRLREWAQTRLAVRPGERALDVGSGTGSET